MNADFTTIDSLKAQWDALQPLAADHERRLWLKFRLEWNYHSNHIEGNTLTYGETELLLIHDQTTGNHALREYEEMKAHDVGISHLVELAADKERPLGESDIRGLNKIILKEPFWKAAITPDGGDSRKQIIPGEYKSMPNNVRTATHEIFEFASPIETPVKMQALVAWLTDNLRGPLDPVALAAKLHYDFVRIHPFDDGNGRVARMLANYVLLYHGYPPLIIPTGEKAQYLNALRLADAGDLLPFVDYLARRVAWSLELGIRAAKGESVDEPGDIEKEIALLVRQQGNQRKRVKPRSPEALRELYNLGFKRLFSVLSEKMRVFDALFVNSRTVIDPHYPGGSESPTAAFEYQMSHRFEGINRFVVSYLLEGYMSEATHPFNVMKSMVIEFGDFSYTIAIEGERVAEKLYSEPILAEEANSIAERLLKAILNQIKANLGQE